jgi:hypothetical protein
MAEYYGYAERDANSYVDWGKLGQNLTETVQTAYQIREERKAQLDELMQKNYAELANSPTGENQDINGAVTGLADNQKQYLLQVNKLLKAGILKPKDYTLINQNLAEDTKALFSNAKNWQDAYGKILERNKNNTGSKAELDISSDVAAFGKFKDLQFMINPTTGRINGAQMTKGPNGELIKGDTKSMQQLNVLMNQPIDKYQLTEKLTQAEKALGDFTTSILTRAAIQRQGSILNVEDKAIKSTFESAKNTFVNEVMANPFNVMSILVDSAGVIPGTTTPYRVSTKTSDRGKPDVIFYHDPDGDGSYNPEFTADQRKAAQQYVIDQFVGMIDRKEETSVVSAISPSYEPEYIAAGRGKEAEKRSAVGAWDKLRWGSAEEKKAAANILIGTDRAQEAGLIDIDMTTNPGSVVLKYSNPDKNRTIAITENGADWSAIGVELHGENDVNKAKKAAGGTWSKPLNPDYTDVRVIRQGGDYSKQMSNYVSQVIPEALVEDDSKATASNLNDNLKELGFSVKGDWEGFGSDYIVITAPDGSKSGKISIEDGAGGSEIEAFLLSKIDSNKAGNFFDNTGDAKASTGNASTSGGNAR